MEKSKLTAVKSSKRVASNGNSRFLHIESYHNSLLKLKLKTISGATKTIVDSTKVTLSLHISVAKVLTYINLFGFYSTASVSRVFYRYTKGFYRWIKVFYRCLSNIFSLRKNIYIDVYKVFYRYILVFKTSIKNPTTTFYVCGGA